MVATVTRNITTENNAEIAGRTPTTLRHSGQPVSRNSIALIGIASLEQCGHLLYSCMARVSSTCSVQSNLKAFGSSYTATIQNKNEDLTVTEVTIAVWDESNSAGRGSLPRPGESTRLVSLAADQSERRFIDRFRVYKYSDCHRAINVIDLS